MRKTLSKNEKICYNEVSSCTNYFSMKNTKVSTGKRRSIFPAAAVLVAVERRHWLFIPKRWKNSPFWRASCQWTEFHFRRWAI